MERQPRQEEHDASASKGSPTAGLVWSSTPFFDMRFCC
jgi:hypothetical protein